WYTDNGQLAVAFWIDDSQNHVLQGVLGFPSTGFAWTQRIGCCDQGLDGWGIRGIEYLKRRCAGVVDSLWHHGGDGFHVGSIAAWRTHECILADSGRVQEFFGLGSAHGTCLSE